MFKRWVGYWEDSTLLPRKTNFKMVETANVLLDAVVID